MQLASFCRYPSARVPKDHQDVSSLARGPLASLSERLAPGLRFFPVPVPDRPSTRVAACLPLARRRSEFPRSAFLLRLGRVPPRRRWYLELRLVTKHHQDSTTARVGQASQQRWPVVFHDACTAVHFRSPVQHALAPDCHAAGNRRPPLTARTTTPRGVRLHGPGSFTPGNYSPRLSQ